ncbi:endonuclease-reverse transcriptase [Lasius niger]|uniref:Endonuclease-reverse transcriptase n=1 Tax=Lasius niger TaxID=67767 RepID=A0A0J7NAU6_LASNI|nr:endonuclease-reverse transcriptase [Lasius niger]
MEQDFKKNKSREVYKAVNLFKKRGLKHGDGLAPILFNLALEYVIRKAQIDVGSTIMNKSVQLTGYADDIDILGRSVCSIKEAFLNLEEAAKEIGLKVNAEKTKAERLQWGGHIQRIQDGRIPQKILEGQPGGKRPVGKPRAKWEDGMEADAREILGFSWRGVSGDRDAWRRRIGKAKADLSCSVIGRKRRKFFKNS